MTAGVIETLKETPALCHNFQADFGLLRKHMLLTLIKIIKKKIKIKLKVKIEN